MSTLLMTAASAARDDGKLSDAAYAELANKLSSLSLDQQEAVTGICNHAVGLLREVSVFASPEVKAFDWTGLVTMIVPLLSLVPGLNFLAPVITTLLPYIISLLQNASGGEAPTPVL